MPLTRQLGTPLIRMGAVTSTMDIARRLETLGAPEGTTVIASSQTLGRGRSDRVWQSPANSGLYCSILLLPNLQLSEFQPFSVAVGLAICEVLDPDNHIGLQLKWPNDILFEGRKLGGIIITTVLSGQKVTAATLGIGLNLRPDPTLPETAIALEDVPGIPNSLVRCPEHRILSELSVRYTQLTSGESAPIANWPTRLAFLGDLVNIHDGVSDLSGTLLGLDAQGALILRIPGGNQKISSGELTRGPRLT